MVAYVFFGRGVLLFGLHQSTLNFNRSMSSKTPKFKKRPKGFSTKAIHIGQEPEQWNSMAVVPPIFMSSTYKMLAPGVHRGYQYSRVGSPIRSTLEKCIASLDNAKYALTFSSGMGSIATLFALLNTGDHIVVGDDIYGGTHRLLREIYSCLGISCTFVDLTNVDKFKAAIRRNTRMAFFETPTNPMIKVGDIRAISKACHKKGDIIVAVDNTFLTSYFQRPLELGADLVCYSLTKYMNGHTDVVMGAITTNNDKLYQRLQFLQTTMGAVPSPFDCFQVNRGLKTLALRMEKHQSSAIAIAKFLESHDFVKKVLNPVLPSHPQHKLTLRQTNGYSGVFSFYIKGNVKNAKAFLKELKVFTLALSLGGYESLIEIPSIMTHKFVPKKVRKQLGMTDTLIRVSVGLEDVDDLIADLKRGLDAARCA